jgi:hypothetical protein
LTVVLATIATIFLMMPGFAFIAGVNVTDKNVREIVFRGTPAELAYVVAVSLIVHCGFSLQPYPRVNPGMLLTRYVDWYQAAFNATPPAVFGLPPIISTALLYFIVSAVAGAVLGFLLGKAVQWWNIRFFIKHRWMVDLIGRSRGKGIYARAVTTPAYSKAREDGDFAIVVEGTVRDCYFAADGTLLYLVFTSFNEHVVRLGEPLFHSVSAAGGRTGDTTTGDGPLVLEGRHVSMVRYERFSVGGSGATLAVWKRLVQGPGDSAGG